MRNPKAIEQKSAQIKNVIQQLNTIISKQHPNEHALELVSCLALLSPMSNQDELANQYFEQIYAPLAQYCGRSKEEEAPSTLNDTILDVFPSSSFGKLTQKNQLDLTNAMFGLIGQGVSESNILEKFSTLEISNQHLVEFAQGLINDIDNSSNLQKLTLFADFMKSMNKDSIDFLQFLTGFYDIVIAKQNQATLKKISYPLAVLLQVHNHILQSLIVNDVSIDFTQIEIQGTFPGAKKNNSKSLSIYEIAGAYKENSHSYYILGQISNIINFMTNDDNVEESIEKSSLYFLMKQLFVCLTTYSHFLYNHVSGTISNHLLPLMSNLEKMLPRIQVGIIRIFSDVLAATKELFEDLNIYPYVQIMNCILALKSSLPAKYDNSLIRSQNYHVIEIENEVKKLVGIIGKENLQYIVYGIIRHIMTQSSKDNKQMVDEEGKQGDDDEDTVPQVQQLSKLKKTSLYADMMVSGQSVIFKDKNLVDSLYILNQLAMNNSNFLSYYLVKALELKKLSKSFITTSSFNQGKKIVTNIGFKTLQAVKSFYTLNIDFWRKAVQSTIFMDILSEYLIKGDIKGEITDLLCKIIINLIDQKSIMTQALSKLQDFKFGKLNEAQTEKKQATLRTYFKKIDNILDELVQNFQEVLPEEIVAIVCSSAIESDTPIKIKTRIHQLFYDKISSIHHPKLTKPTIKEAKDQIENTLAAYAKEKDSSFSSETVAYLQATFLSLSILIKKKPKVFEEGLNSAIYEYAGHKIFEIRCSAFYALCMQAEKFGNKNLEQLPKIIDELMFTFLVCVKSLDGELYALLQTIIAEDKITHLQKAYQKVEKYDHEKNVINSVDGCFVLCMNSLILLTESYKDIMHPYILSFLYIVGSIKDYVERIQDLLSLMAKCIEPRNMVDSLTKAAERQHSFGHLFTQRISILLSNVCERMDKDTFEVRNTGLFKILLIGLDYTRVIYQQGENQEEFDLEEIEATQLCWVDAFTTFAVKTNEIQLKKFFLKLNEWSSKSFKGEENQFSIFRKIVVFQLMNKLFGVLTTYFIPYMAFVFDFCLDQLTHYVEVYGNVTSVKLSKRKRLEADDTTQWEVKLHKLILETLTNCFIYDKEEFIDTSKFEKLQDPLTNQIDCIGVPCDYKQFIAQSVEPAILQLFELVRDDYKWKTLNYNIMMKTRNEDNNSKIAALKITYKMIEQLKDRVAVLLNDIIPFVSETLEDENIEVEKLSKDIVLKLEQITGEDMKEYLR